MEPTTDSINESEKMQEKNPSEFNFQEQNFDGSGIKFSSVSVTLNSQQILFDVTGCAPVGEVLAVMGPSGSGKTTLLNSISGRIELQAGEITLYGEKVGKATRRKINYVLQQDILFSDLTMKETLYFAAMLRLPASMSHKQKMDRMDYIVDALKIRDCLNTKVGSIMQRGLSGGEMKRASIACELITNPDIILLDEPTSGLDSYTAFQLMKQLKEYATTLKKVVITTIHQPSSQIFHSFDKLLLLAKGKTVYFGQPNAVLVFFESCGLLCEPHYNPADFILEKVNGKKDELQKILAAASSKFSTESPGGVINTGFCNETSDKDISLKGGYMNRRHKTIDLELAAPSRGRVMHKGNNLDNKKWPTGFWTQYRYLALRQFKISKAKILSKLEIFQVVAISLLIGVTWFQFERTDETVRDITGLLFFTASNWHIKYLLSSVVAFPSEMTVINKERASGMYRLSAYILSKFTSEFPLTIVLPCLCQPILYWMTGLNPNVGIFFAFVGVTIVNALVGQSAGLLIGAVFTRVDIALTTVTLYLLSILILGGFFTRNLPTWLSWLQYVSTLYYPYRALLYLEFASNKPIKCVLGQNSTFAECSQKWNISSSNETLYFPSRAALQLEGVKAPLYCYIFSMFCIILLFRFLVYVAFRLLRKPK